uniref:RRM domain-containing protein n=1 Tax=Parascaris univalens TaxID=6257 RepID=A0A915AYT4_PARUN
MCLAGYLKVYNMDEEELLLDSTLPVDVKLGDLDEAAILDDDIPLEGGVNTAAIEGTDEGEELDYDEEPDEDAERERAPRAGKFISERTSMRRSSAASTDVPSVRSSKEQCVHDQPSPAISVATSAPSVLASSEPIRANEIQTTASSTHTTSSMTTVSVPSGVTTKAAVTRPPPKVLINPHYKGPIRRTELTINWNAAVGVRSMANVTVPQIRAPFCATPLLPAVHVPPPSLPFPAIASSSTDFSRPPPTVVPIANFATPPPSVYAGAYTTPAPTLVPSSGQWDQLVEGFLRRTTARRISRSRSRSSSSSFSRSRSRSYSSRSRTSTSSGSSHSSSRSPRRELRFQGRRSSSRHSDARNASYGRMRYGDRQRAPLEARIEHRDRKLRTPDITQQEKTIECAKAIGLDSEYLSKLEEQKKMREEILRKKEERRFQNVQRASLSLSSESKQPALDGANAQASRRPEKILKEASDKGSRERDFAQKKSSRISRPIRSRDSPAHPPRFERRQPARNSPQSRVETRRDSPKSQSLDTHRDVSWRTAESVINRGQERQGLVVGNNSARKRDAGSILPRKEASNGTVRKPEKGAINRADLQPVVAQVQAQIKAQPIPGDRAPNKKKAYLAVVVRTSNNVVLDMERMKVIATTIGPIKKAWRSHSDCISLIFESHENAKKFMLQYNGKTLNGMRLIVMLEKVFVNLAEL